MFKTRTRLILGGLLTAVAVALVGSLSIGATRAAADPQLAHMVYFKLKDSSGANRAKLAAACKLYLASHPGTVYFGTGTLAGDLNGNFNDREFDVSLHLVFANKEALENYLVHARHLKFIEENKDNLERIRVFDSYLSPVPASSAEPAVK
jgi:Stress responsive A/B Barrel Domain